MSLPKPKQRSDETIHLILDASAAIFAEMGFAGARMDEIARRAGVNKAMIYYHVGDKAALYAAVFQEAIERNGAILDTAIKKESSCAGRLQAVVATIAQIAASTPHLPRLLLREAASGGANLPEPVLKGIAGIFQKVREILAEGVTQGHFRSVDPLLTHVLIIGSIMFLTSAEPMERRIASLAGLPFAAGALSTEAISRHVADLLLHGLQAAPPRKRGA